jgi:hypothetical protein
MRQDTKALNDRVGKLDDKIDKLSDKTDNLDRKVTAIGSKLTALLWVVGGLGSLITLAITVGKAFGWS